VQIDALLEMTWSMEDLENVRQRTQLVSD